MGAQHGRLLEGDDGWLLQLPGWVVQLQLLPSTITSCCWPQLQLLLLPINSSCSCQLGVRLQLRRQVVAVDQLHRVQAVQEATRLHSAIILLCMVGRVLEYAGMGN